jgi:1-acyl-sn-glycerol-3-phosphate acyltransferase/nucleoside-diphosphate-sugar epimerase
MMRVIVADDRDFLAELIANRLRESPMVDFCTRAAREVDLPGECLLAGFAELLRKQTIDAVVYSPPRCARNSIAPNLEDAELIFQQCARAGIRKFVLLSSAMIYGCSPHNEGLLPETRPILRSELNSVAGAWHDLEALALSYFGESSKTGAELTILRPVAVLVPRGEDYFSRLFRSRIAITLPGHDPTMQLLSPRDLAQAVRCVIEKGKPGVFNVAPKSVITLRAALRLVGARRVPVSRVLQRVVRNAAARAVSTDPIEQLDYIRYSWTVSDEKIRNELSCSPQRSAAEGVAEFFLEEKGETVQDENTLVLQREFDDFGMDKHYIAAYGRTLFKFLHDYYWRVEAKGLDHVPRQGRAVLVGMHRGFMPWDGVMALHLMVQKLRRYPRFLIHPGLIKFPFLFNYMTKLGGIIACQKNAAYVLGRDEMLGVFPEGIRGAFSLYRDAYKVGRFGRDDFVKLALRHRAPIVPFVTVGSAEIFPILKKVDWGWWKRQTEWPSFPITPTFPFLPPVPLPAKWHTQFLAPIHIEDRYPPEAADDPATVRAISLEVRGVMEGAIGEMLVRRKSIFYGSIFEERPGFEEQLRKKPSYEDTIIYKEKLS